MSIISISDIKFLKREQVASLLSNPETASEIAIIDVRDSDRIGGHIKSSQWIPINTLDYKLPELIRILKAKKKVVFHCALSQQRGPSAALRYARERAKVLKNEKGANEDHQQVCVLEGGFSMWQAKYGDDEKLTAEYAKDLWMD